MFKSESKLGKRANGQEAWQALLKYENNSTQRRRTLKRKLDNSKMEDGQDPHVFFVQVEQLADDLERMGEPTSKHRGICIILSGMTNEYEQIQFQAMKDSEFSLDDLKFTMRNMYVNGLHKSWRQERGSAMSADVARRDKSGLKCHSCGKTGHFQQGCTTNTKKIANAPNAHKMIKPSKKTNSIPDQVVLISQHNVMAQAAGKSSQDTPAQQTRGEGHNANAAPQERNKRGGYCFQG